MRIRSTAICAIALRVQRPSFLLHSSLNRARSEWLDAGDRLEHSVCAVRATRAQEATARQGGPTAKHNQLDYTQLLALYTELQQWVPSKVQRVQLADPYTLALYVIAIDRQGWLYLSWHPRAARVCLGNDPEYGDASSSYPFAQLVRTKLLDQLLIGCSMPVPFDRVMKLEFAPQLDSVTHMSLFCEIQGAYSNMVLVDGQNSTLLAARQIGTQQTSVRAIRVGAPYHPPPPPPGKIPSASESIDQWQSHICVSCQGQQSPLPGLALALVNAYQGVSIALAHELCMRAEICADHPVGALETHAWSRLHNEWQTWLSICESGAFQVTKDHQGRLSVLGSFEQQCYSMHEAINERFSEAQASERFFQLRAALTKALSAAVHKLKGKISAFEAQLNTADEAEATQKQADMVMANIYCWPKGALQMEVDDWETGEKVNLKIADVALSPVEHAEKLYKRAAKQRRAAEKLQPLKEEAEKLLIYVEEVQETVNLLERMATIQDFKALQGIQDELIDQGLMKTPSDAKLAAKSKAKAQKAAKKRKNVSPGGSASPYRLFTSPSGLQILIGRNNRQNDELSTKVANAGDIWMHARSVPGSHLVMRVPAGKLANDEDIQYAANLSVYFSKARDSGKWDVTMTDARNVKKPKGAKPGQVLVREEMVVTGFPGTGAVEQV